MNRRGIRETNLHKGLRQTHLCRPIAVSGSGSGVGPGITCTTIITVRATETTCKSQDELIMLASARHREAVTENSSGSLQAYKYFQGGFPVCV